MFALSDSQLRSIWEAADSLPAEKRGIFLERMIAWLQFRGGRFIERDFDDAVRLAPAGIDPRVGGLISTSEIVRGRTGQRIEAELRRYAQSPPHFGLLGRPRREGRHQYRGLKC